MSLAIPADVLDWISHVFADINWYLAAKISKIPNIHEGALDMSFVNKISDYSTPVRFPSDWTILLDTHYLGGGRHWMGTWEIADIGVLVVFRHRGRALRAKVGLLQSKRLYPKERLYASDEVMVDRAHGFGDLWLSEEVFLQASSARTFTFQSSCRYKALILGDNQCIAIQQYEAKTSVPIFYLLYHPLQIPWQARIPLMHSKTFPQPNDVGCTVVSAKALYDSLQHDDTGRSPSYSDIMVGGGSNVDHSVPLDKWRLENFIVDELLGCNVGYIAADHYDENVQQVFFDRGAPISAAISINVEVPPELEDPGFG